MESSQNNTKTEYTPNEYVSYGTSGVCQIVSVEQRSFDGEHEESYYKLRPVGNGNSTYYVPVERAADRLRPLLTKEQIYGLIDEMADVDFSEIFQNILHSDDYKEMMQMMHTLYQQQERKRRSGHRLAAADEAAMHAAENRMYQEFGIVLDIQPEQVHSFIMKRMDAVSSTKS